MNKLYPSTGDLLIKSGTAIEQLSKGPHAQADALQTLCKSIAATLAPCQGISSRIAQSVDVMNQSAFGVDTTQLHSKLLAEKELRKCLDTMRVKRMPASVIVKFQQATEAALVNPAIDNGALTKALTKLNKG